MEQKKCVVIANGEFPQKAHTQSVIGQAEMIVCCDGATDSLLRYGREPDYIVGDCDSISDALRARFADRLTHIAEQDDNDLTKCMRFAQAQNVSEVVILGATGRREDHTLGNISLLTVYRNWFRRVTMVSDYGVFEPIYNTATFSSFPGQQISVFALPPVPHITLHDLRYPFVNRQPMIWWEVSLNEALTDSFTIELHEPGNVIVYKLFEKESKE